MGKKTDTSRRDFLKITGAVGLGLGAAALSSSPKTADATQKLVKPLKKSKERSNQMGEIIVRIDQKSGAVIKVEQKMDNDRVITLDPSPNLFLGTPKEVAEIKAHRDSFDRIVQVPLELWEIKGRSICTIVIGGLSKETSSRSTTGTPLLEDVPGLGWLFKRKSDADQFEDLLIFITPHILKPKAAGGRL